MNKKCAKCSKTVYPTEELKCLDKIWHKFCFKCDTCGMTLTMKNYKGYDKIPYCNAHYPSTKPTAVADTPESRRIAENTKIQSNVQYHADFERQKGQKTSVASDPETARIKQNTAIQSNVNYWGVREQRQQMETKRPNEMMDDGTKRSRNPGKISEYDPAVEQDFASPYSQRNMANVVYDSQRGEEPRSPNQRSSQRSSGHQQPFSYGGGGQPPSQLHGNNPSRSSYGEDGGNRGQRSSYGEAQQVPYSGGGKNSSGWDSNPSPSRTSYGDKNNGTQGFSYAPAGGYNNAGPAGYGGDARSSYTEPTPQAQPQPMRSSHPPPPKQPTFKAVYDYAAADTDEVSFNEGDLILNTDVIDAGWMTGMVQRTGQTGMLPSNYVERVN